MTILLFLFLSVQEADLRWHMKKGDHWIEHRRNEYLTTEGMSRSRLLLETKTEFVVESEEKDGAVLLSRTVLAFTFQVEKPEGNVDVAFENGAWKKSEWKDYEGVKEDYEEFVLHPPKLTGKPNGEMRALEEGGEAFPHSPALLPSRPVKVGDSWEVPREAEGPTEFLIVMKLSSIQGRTAVLQMTMTLPETVPSLTEDVAARGSIPLTIEFDLEAGIPRSQKGSGEIVFSRTNPAGGAPIITRLERKVETTWKRK